MPLKLPDLDDRRYKDLADEGRSLIPAYAEEWTNHNPSDPGITLVELFAYLTEMMIYRLNRVTHDQKIKFLKLLRGPEWAPPEGRTLIEEIRETVLLFRTQDRTVTCEDFENLARAADPGVVRARCVPRRNLEFDPSPDRSTDRPGHVSVVIVPDSAESSPYPQNDLISTVKEYLEPRRLLTTVVHVVGPRYVTIGVRIRLVLKPDALEETVEEKAKNALTGFFSPLPGQEGEGWPFGRNVYVSEIYELLDRVDGVDYVQRKNEATEELTVDVNNQARLIRNDQQELVGVALLPDELVNIQIDSGDIDTILRK